MTECELTNDELLNKFMPGTPGVYSLAAQGANQCAKRELLEPLAQKLYDADKENRAAIIAFPDSGERDVLRQLAKMPRWDGNISSKSARSSLVHKGLVSCWNGFNFLTQSGYAVVDSLWGLEHFIKS